VSNQDIEGKGPGDTGPTAPAGTPEYFEQQLAKEREARALMRDRLRHTEALAAESHALRARMAQELERVTAERDRLRNAAAAASAAAGAAPVRPGAAAAPSPPVAPPMTPRAEEWPLRPPTPPRRSGPWLALAMLAGLAVGIAGLAWVTGSMPGAGSLFASAPAGAASDAAPLAVAASAAPSSVAAPRELAVASPMPAAASALPNGAVALPPLSPEAALAAAPTAAGSAPGATPAGLPARLRTALDGEGIAAPVDIDTSTGRVAVSDPAADATQRDRTDLIIRAVYAGASLPEPLIEHRWLSPPRAGRQASAALAAPAVAPATPDTEARTSARATTSRVPENARRAESVADAAEARPILPAGRVTAGCKAAVAGRSTAHQAAALSSCIKHSCCSTANRQTEECRAYDKAYPFSCSAG
jgi:hypothetical protein